MAEAAFRAEIQRVSFRGPLEFYRASVERGLFPGGFRQSIGRQAQIVESKIHRDLKLLEESVGKACGPDTDKVFLPLRAGKGVLILWVADHQGREIRNPAVWAKRTGDEQPLERVHVQGCSAFSGGAFRGELAGGTYVVDVAGPGAGRPLSQRSIEIQPQRAAFGVIFLPRGVQTKCELGSCNIR